MNAINSTAIHAKIRISRLGGNAADTYVGDARFLGFDFHVPVDQLGSRQEFIVITSYSIHYTKLYEILRITKF